MRILTVNVGSTSVKLRVLDDDDKIVGSVDLTAGSARDREVVSDALGSLGPVEAVGHRIVHGGLSFTAPVLVDTGVMEVLRALTDLAPLHQPPALDLLDVISNAIPDIPAVACFDTAFHATLPEEAFTYALPPAWRELGTRRFGFHGLSHEWAAKRAVEVAALDRSCARVVSCHLGGGGSLAAVFGGSSIDTTMGFTPLDGLVMATRPGQLDPGVILWLQQRRGLSADEVADALEHHSGLVGLCGTGDMRQVTDRCNAGDPTAAMAFSVYVHRLKAGIAAMAASLGGLDVLAFTGGIGEGSASVRASACASLGFLGVAIDAVANLADSPEREVSPPGCRTPVVVVQAREDLQLAKGVRSVLRPERPPVN